jgi:hypothetical protein
MYMWLKVVVKLTGYSLMVLLNGVSSRHAVGTGSKGLRAGAAISVFANFGRKSRGCKVGTKSSLSGV